MGTSTFVGIRLPGVMLGLLLGISVGIVTGCSSKDKGGTGDGSQAKEKTGGDKGGGSGDKKSYTQRILDLDPKVQQECKVKIPKGSKPLHPPGSVADFVQSVTLFNGGASCWDVNKESDMKRHFGYLGEFMVQWTYAVPIPRKVWEDVYGAPQGLTTKQEGLGVKRSIMVDVDHWIVECTDEKLNVRGACVDKTLQDGGTTKGKVILQFAHFSKRRAELCPKASEIFRDIRFEYK